LSRVSVAVRQVDEGSGQVGRDVDDVSGVEWLRREHRLVVFSQTCLSTVLDGAGIVSASPNSFNLRRQSCVNGWYLKEWDDPEWLFFFHLVILAYLARGVLGGLDPERPREVGPLVLQP